MKIRKIVFFLIIFLVLFFPLLAQDYNNTTIISVSQNPQAIRKINKLNLDILMIWQGRIYIICNRQLDDLLKIKKANIAYQIETQKFYPFSNKDANLQGSINGPYHTYQELENDLMTLEERFPDLAKLYILGQSLENRNIYALKISDNVSLEEAEAEVLFIGCHHAREWISVEVPYLLAKYLVENYSRQLTIKNLVDHSQIWIIPLLNPDGLEYSIHFYRYWRKNRRNNGDGSYGVDLNRNYSYNWGLDNEGSSPNSFSNVYRGKSPFSEPETQAVRDFCLTRRFQALISYHNYSQVILYPWGYTSVPSPKNKLLEEMAAQMSELIQAVNGRFYEYGQAGNSFYLTNGDTTDWALGVYHIPAFTIELPPVDVLHGGFFNSGEDIQSIFKENLPAALYLIDWSMKNFSEQFSNSTGTKGEKNKQRKNLTIFVKRDKK